MKVVGLISGGKDSIFNLMYASALGHEIVGLLNLWPAEEQEIDSELFQSVGFEHIELMAQAMDLPLVRAPMRLGQEAQNLHDALGELPPFEGLAVGAILSNDQRTRIENVAYVKGLKVLAFLWQGSQVQLIRNMITSQMTVKLVKVAAMGLNAQHLGALLDQDLEAYLTKMSAETGFHAAGEGGEYESLCLDSFLFKSRLAEVEAAEVCRHMEDDLAPTLYLKGGKFELVAKTMETLEAQREAFEGSLKFVTGLDSYAVALTGDLNEKYPIAAANQPLDVQVPRIPLFFGGPYRPGWKNHQGLWVSTPYYSSDKGDLAQDLQETLALAEQDVKYQGVSLKSDTVFVEVHLQNMEDFSVFNQVYADYFLPKRVGNPQCPPGRWCLTSNVDHRFALRFYCGPVESSVFVQSISRWAMAAIGPYCQLRVLPHRRAILLSGVIGLIPYSMELPESLEDQLTLALYSAANILDAQQMKLRDLSLLTVFVVGHQIEFNHPFLPPINQVVVNALPRGALVEVSGIRCDSTLIFEADDPEAVFLELDSHKGMVWTLYSKVPLLEAYREKLEVLNVSIFFCLRVGDKNLRLVGWRLADDETKASTP